MGLAFFGCVFLAWAAGMRVVHHYANAKGALAAELADIVATTVSLTAAWCMLSATKWFWLARFAHNLFLGKVLGAMTWSLLFVVQVFVVFLVLQKLPPNVRRSMRGEFTSIGLAVGLAWEHLFDHAVEDVSKYQFSNEPVLEKA